MSTAHNNAYALVERIEFKPAFDCINKRPCHFGRDTCEPDAGGSHGRGSVKMRWIATDGLVAVQFMAYTGWGIDETPEHYRWSPPLAVDLGFHIAGHGIGDWLYETNNCDVVDGGRCSYDGSGTMADEPWRLLRYEGHEAVWEFLRARHAEIRAEYADHLAAYTGPSTQPTDQR